MKPGLKRGLKIAAVVLLILIGVPAAVIGSAFVGTSDIKEVELEPGIQIVKDGIVSVGVIDIGGGKVALIDAGNDKDGKAILADLKKKNLGPEAVTAVLLTHGHPDHLNGCHLFPHAAIYALAEDVALAEGREAGKSTMGKIIGAKPTGLKITNPIDDGATLVLGNRSVRVFSIPGHTGGSAAYLVDGVLFLGDSVGSTKEGTIRAAPPLFSDNPAQNRASIHALALRLQPIAPQIRELVPAHSGPLRGLDPLLAFTP